MQIGCLSLLNIRVVQGTSTRGFSNMTVQQQLKQLFNLFIEELPGERNELRREIFQLFLDHIDQLADLQHVMPDMPASLFAGTSWADTHALKPELVYGTLLSGGLLAGGEIASSMRMLAIAQGKMTDPACTSADAQQYAEQVLALNFDVLFPLETEEARLFSTPTMAIPSALLRHMANQLPSGSFLDKLTDEIEKLSVQRSIITDKMTSLIEAGIKAGTSSPLPPRFLIYSSALQGGTDTPLHTLDKNNLVNESLRLSSAMHQTGIVSVRHANLIRYVSEYAPEYLDVSLGLTAAGNACLKQHLPLVQEIISLTLTKETRQSVYGLARFLERDIPLGSLLAKLVSLAQVKPHEENLARVRGGRGKDGTAAASSWIASGMVSLLGQPLGIGQGLNPTCQSTRALSYWAQTDPRKLVDLCMNAVLNDEITFNYEGTSISSALLPKYEVCHTIKMDAVSTIMLPHLHAIYLSMLSRTAHLNEDPHKWVNPAFYGDKVAAGFVSTHSSRHVASDFTRHYHPVYGDNACAHCLPQPAGVLIKDTNGHALGAHAILIQRIKMFEDGSARVYFYNPNNDSVQTWGKNIVTSVTGHGEEPGESSLAFEQFAECVYAYHHPTDHQLTLQGKHLA